MKTRFQISRKRGQSPFTLHSQLIAAIKREAQAARERQARIILGEAELAIAGGVQVLPTPVIFVEFSRLRGLAPDGRVIDCRGSANGHPPLAEAKLEVVNTLEILRLIQRKYPELIKEFEDLIK